VDDVIIRAGTFPLLPFFPCYVLDLAFRKKRNTPLLIVPVAKKRSPPPSLFLPNPVLLCDHRDWGEEKEKLRLRSLFSPPFFSPLRRDRPDFGERGKIGVPRPLFILSLPKYILLLSISIIWRRKWEKENSPPPSSSPYASSLPHVRERERSVDVPLSPFPPLPC